MEFHPNFEKHKATEHEHRRSKKKSDAANQPVESSSRSSGRSSGTTDATLTHISFLQENHKRTLKLPSKQHLEKNFPAIHYLVHQKNEWDPLFKIFKLTEEMINNKKIYNKDLSKNEIPELHRHYKEWLSLARSSQLLHDVNMRKLSKQLSMFVIAAFEEPTHTVRIQHLPKTMKNRMKMNIKKHSPRSFVFSMTSSPHSLKQYMARSAKMPAELWLERSTISTFKSTRHTQTSPTSLQYPNSIRASTSADGKRFSTILPKSIDSTISLPIYSTTSIPELTTLGKDESSRESHTDPTATKVEELYYMQVIFRDVLKDISRMGEIQIRKPRSRSIKRTQRTATYPPKLSAPTMRTSHPPTPRFVSVISAKCDSRIFTKITPAQKALNEMKSFRRGLWGKFRIDEMIKKYPYLPQETKNFHIKKSLITPQERAKIIMQSKPPCPKRPLLPLGSKHPKINI